MIIKRLAEGIKKQDWFVVTIEIVIVVVGIFIGLQVDEWNTSRINDQRAVEVIEELQVDFERIEQSATNLADFYANILVKMKALRIILDAGVVRPEDEQAVKDGISSASNWGDPPPPSGIFRDLVSSGNLSLIRNKELRMRLMEYDQSIGMIEKSDLNINILIAQFEVVLGRHSSVSLDFAVPDKEDLAFIDITLPRTENVQYDAMLADPDFRGAIDHNTTLLFSRYANIRVVMGKISQVQKLLDAETAGD